MSHGSGAPANRCSVAQYPKLGDPGIFSESGHVELLNGDLILTAPIGVRPMPSIARPVARTGGKHFFTGAPIPASANYV